MLIIVRRLASYLIEYLNSLKKRGCNSNKQPLEKHGSKQSMTTTQSIDIIVQMNTISGIQRAMDYLIARAELSYNGNCGGCAKMVREAVEFGFCPEKMERTTSAKDYGPLYEKFGFKKIYSSNLENKIDYKPGDIVIIQYDPHGHIAMLCKGIDPKTGKEIQCWISDFRQRDLYGGKIRSEDPHFDIYRISR